MVRITNRISPTVRGCKDVFFKYGCVLFSCIENRKYIVSFASFRTGKSYMCEQGRACSHGSSLVGQSHKCKGVIVMLKVSTIYKDVHAWM